MDEYRFYIWVQADSRDAAIEIVDGLQADGVILESDYEYEWDN